MKIPVVFFFGFLFSLLVILVLANDIEHGQRNAILMYLLVYLVPVLILAFANSLYIGMVGLLGNGISKTILSLIPVAVLVFLASKKELSIEGIDGDLRFAAHVASVAIGLTNVLWFISSLRDKAVRK